MLLAAALLMRQCSRRLSSSNLRSLGVFKRLDRVGGSDGVLKGGSERGWKRAPKRSVNKTVMYAESE